jgi:hypothetical protein
MTTASLIAVHVLAAAFWLGATLFLIFFVVPTVIKAGPEGGAFMGKLVTTSGFQRAFAIAGGTTILSGLLALWIVSGGFQPAFMKSTTGMFISGGALSGILAVITGSTAGRLQQRGAPYAMATAGLLTLALVLMVLGAHV